MSKTFLLEERHSKESQQLLASSSADSAECERRKISASSRTSSGFGSGGGEQKLNYVTVQLPYAERTAVCKQMDRLENGSEKGDEEDPGWKPGSGQISENEIRMSLLVEAKRQSFWSAKQLDKLSIERIAHGVCFHYALESFTEMRAVAEVAVEQKRKSSAESRTTTTAVVPIHPSAAAAGRIDQHVWDLDVQPDDDFINQVKILEMPNSHRLAACHSCAGRAMFHCFHCQGVGTTDKCTHCRATGMKSGVAHPAVFAHPPEIFLNQDGLSTNSSLLRPNLTTAAGDQLKPYAPGTPAAFRDKFGLLPPGVSKQCLCTHCQGRGTAQCEHCKGVGHKCCMHCGGLGQMGAYTKLKVTFATKCTDYFTPCEVPVAMLAKASGEQLICSETAQPFVKPIGRPGLDELHEVSAQLCVEHIEQRRDYCRVLKQRHCVEAIEVAKVRFRLGAKRGHFYVYGRQRLCYFPEAPCCCCCCPIS